MTYLLISASVICSTSPVASEVVAAAQKQAMLVQSLDYSFRYSLYPGEVLRFRSSGSMTRCDATLPTAAASGEVIRGEKTYAFNGKRYQSRSKLGRVLSKSRQPLGGTLQSGPCWTPLEQCYRWLRVADPDFCWMKLRDPMVWRKLKPEPEVMEEVCAGVACVRLAFRRNNGVVVHVYFGREQVFFPLRWDVIASDGHQVSTFTVEEFKEVQNAGQEVWMPIRMTYHTESHGPIPERLRKYEVLPETLLLNQPIDPSIFTLEPIDVDEVIDWDTNEVYLPATKQILPLYDNRPALQLAEAPAANGRIALLIVNVVVIIILAGVFWWRKSH